MWKSLLLILIYMYKYQLSLLYLWEDEFEIIQCYLYYVESNIPTPNSKFLREKCSVKTDVFFVAKVRNK